MPKLPSRFRRLDDILADLAIEDPMLLTELDGYLTAVAVCPQPMPAAEWLPPIWGGVYGEPAPFDEPADVPLFADMVRARHDEIVRDLGRGRLQPIFDIDERNGDVLWETWVEGFAAAMALRPDAWTAIADGDDADAAAGLAAMIVLTDVAAEDTALTSMEINLVCDEAAALIPAHVARLYAWRGRQVEPVAVDRSAKVGRNAPCPCGSGQKHKRCCGSH